MKNAEFNGPLFIIGMPRSGTKLLRGLLNRHSLISIPISETEFLPWMVHNWARFGNLSDRSIFTKFYSEISGLHFFQYMAKSGMPIPEQAWYDACESYTPAGVFEAMVRYAVSMPSGKPGIWGDKSPSYITHIALIKKLYPEAKIIHIVRDVRDYCLSMKKAWGKSMLRAAQRWADDIGMLERVRKDFHDDVIVIRYQDLLDRTEEEIKRLCAFLGLEYQKSMCSLGAPVENLGDAKGVCGIKKDNKNKFLSEMKPAMCMKIESIAWPMLAAYGYEYSYQGKVKRVNPVLMKILQMHDAINLFRFHVREQGFMRGVSLVFSLYLTSGNRRV